MHPLEQVGITTHTVSNNMVPPSQTTPVLFDELPTELEVTFDFLLGNEPNGISTYEVTSKSLLDVLNDIYSQC